MVKGELFKFFTELLSSTPKVAIIVNNKILELEEAISDFPFESEIVEFKTFEREGVGLDVHAHMFEPLYPIAPRDAESRKGKGKLPEHYLDWRKMLRWVDENIREVANALEDHILQLPELNLNPMAVIFASTRENRLQNLFFTAFLLSKHSLRVRIRTNPATFKDPLKLTGDKVYIGWFFKQKHHQEREFKITSKEQIDDAMELITHSYNLIK